MEIENNTLNPSQGSEFVESIISSKKKVFDYKVYEQFLGKNHKINSQFERENKTIRVPIGDGSKDQNGEDVLINKTVKVARISTEFQKLITTIATSFGAGGGVILKAKAEEQQKPMLIKAKDVWKRSKCEFINYEILETIYSQKQVAEVWYSKPNGELRCNIYKPSDGYELIPVFNGNKDLIYFGLKYEVEIGKSTEQRIDIYSNDFLYRYKKDKDWVLIEEPIKLLYGKMPVIYYEYDEVIYEGVQSLIERYEVLLSNFADTNDYNGSPILFGKGTITGFGAKGETGKYIEGEGDAELKYISNNAVPESVKLEFETIKNLIYTLTLTPELSFDIMVNLGNVSGLAMDRILTGAHLKAKKIQNGVYGMGIQRRLNFLVSALSNIIPELVTGKELYITPQFNLFRISSESEKITNMLLANGNMPIIDHESSIEEVGLVENPEQAMKIIEKKLNKFGKTGQNANNTAIQQ